jgi:hypothetical protein
MSRFNLRDPEDMPKHYEAEDKLPEVYQNSRHVGDRHLETDRVLRGLANNESILELHTNAFLSLWREDMTGLKPKENELVILMTGRAYGSIGGQNEWDSHIQNAMTVGWEPEEIIALGEGNFDELDDKYAALARYVTAVANMEVTDQLHEDLSQYYDESTMIGILVLCGYYALCAKVIDGLGIDPTEPGEEYEDIGYESVVKN